MLYCSVCGHCTVWFSLLCYMISGCVKLSLNGINIKNLPQDVNIYIAVRGCPINRFIK